MIRRLPLEAIPDRYRVSKPTSSRILDTPICQFSLRVDNEGLSVSSAVSRASIPWKDLKYVEEVYRSTGDGPPAPALFLFSHTDVFELTTFWNRYKEIRNFVIANAPDGSIVVV